MLLNNASFVNTLSNMPDAGADMENETTKTPTEPKPQPMLTKMTENTIETLTNFGKTLNNTLKRKVH